MNTIKINGKTIFSNISGGNIVISNGKVTIDGKNVDVGNEKTINIEINGNIDSLSADACNSISVTGSAKTVKTLSGDIKCGNVAGSVQTMSGDVSCGTVSGDVSTMSGDINKH